MARFKYHKPKVKQLGPRVPLIELPDEDRFSPDLIERKKLYSTAQWTNLRKELLKQKSMRRCFFCNAWSTTLEHLVGHGADALEVGRLLGVSGLQEDWQDRFWSGPFCGSCNYCARSRSGAETSRRLANWTRNWLSKHEKLDKDKMVFVRGQADILC